MGFVGTAVQFGLGSRFSRASDRSWGHSKRSQIGVGDPPVTEPPLPAKGSTTGASSRSRAVYLRPDA